MTRKSVKLTKTEAARIFREADAAGREAAAKCVPVPMHVVERANPIDDNSPIIKDYGPIASGVCGFGWVEIRPSRGGIASWMKDKGHGRYSEYSRCWYYSSPMMTQSLEINYAYAAAFASVLRSYDIDARAMSRMD